MNESIQRPSDEIVEAADHSIGAARNMGAAREELEIGRFKTPDFLEEITRAYKALEGEDGSEKGELSITSEQAKAIAFQFFISSRAEAGETIVIQTTEDAIQITREIVALCEANNVRYVFDFVDYAHDAILAKHLSDQPEKEGEKSPLQIFAETKLAIYKAIGKTISVISNPDPRIAQFADPDKSKRLAELTAEINQRKRSGNLHYVTTRIPTRADAQRDKVDYEDYVRIFMEACDQPWDAIKGAQVKLKEKFDSAETLHITNDDGTNITLDITGQTFANSVVLKNIPGSEIFSSPLKEGVNGEIVSRGRFQYGNSGVIEDITLVFERGRIVDFDAKVGKDALKRIIEMDDGKGDGTRYVGEIGIGTNPHLRKHTLNPLLVEKVGGSFHVAVGSCYSYDVYDGEPVSLKNGNSSTSGTHWDLTTLLRGQNSKMELGFADGKVEKVQENGIWLIEGCDVLNQGWNAMPEANRPSWWNERYPDGYQDAE